MIEVCKSWTMSLSKDLLFLIRQFCHEEKLDKTVHMLEQETGVFFDLDYLDELVMSGEWNEAEIYLSGFASVGSNPHSMKMFFEIRKQKFYEALDKHDVSGALDILLKDLKVFSSSNEELYRELTSLLTLDDFREHPSLSSYGDVVSARREMMDAIKLIIKANPLFCDKLDFPQVEKSRLRRLINQSLNWQHVQCPNPKIEPQISTLLSDHKCSVVESNEKDSMMNAFPPEFRTNSSVPLDKMAFLEHPSVENRNLNFIILDDFPKTVERCMDMSSTPTSMDFHPTKDFLILVGNIMGDVELYDVGSNRKLFSNAFKIWKKEAISEVFLSALETDPLNSVNRVLWSPDGSVCGVAFSRSIVQLYSCDHDTNDIKKQLEIEAHSGGVNDLAFTSRNDELVVITCGEDKVIQVWDSKTGSKVHTFEGHGAPVYSLCPNVNEDIHILFSTSINGEIKAWLFEDTEPIAEYYAPGCSHMKMVYSDDGRRLFSCGTNDDGNSHILEWNQTDGYIIRTYRGLCKSAVGVVHLSTILNRFLVAGDDQAIKVWDMDNVQLVTALDADGGLIETPYVCFNKKGTILAAFADRNKIKILANDEARGLLQSSCSLQKASNFAKVDDMEFYRNMNDLKQEEMVKPQDHMKIDSETNSQKWSKIVQVSHCHSFRLLSEIKTSKLCRLTYTNSGNGILALAADGIHLLWKSSGEGDDGPKLWQPRIGLLMINHLSDENDKFKDVSPCFALSKNDMYLISSSGKDVSLFNTMTFKELKSCLSGPPSVSCIAFYPPDNNVVAVGMDDSTILVYNIRLGEDRSRLVGHMKMVTGLAFSNTLKVLVSSGLDNQIIVWDTATWKKMRNVSLQTQTMSETNIQFHQDQKQFLAIHETQLGVYEATNLKRVNQWMIGEFCARLTNATFSSDNRLVYAIMRGGIVVVLTASDLCPRLEIDPSVYLPSTVSYGVYPIVIAAHPKKPNQFALGLSDGGVVVLEPCEDEETWIIFPQDDDDDDDDEEKEEEEFAFSSTITTN